MQPVPTRTDVIVRDDRELDPTFARIAEAADTAMWEVLTQDFAWPTLTGDEFTQFEALS